MFRESALLVTAAESSQLPQRGIPLNSISSVQHYLGRLDEVDCFTFEVAAEVEPPSGYRWSSLRALFTRLPDALLAIAGRALQIIEWDRSHKFCGRCGNPTIDRLHERAKQCPRCQHIAYPRVSPAMMILIERGREILLARAHHFPPGRYSALAGFVEPGESVEDTIAREVYEEVGLRLTHTRYFASQSWPFPHSLMLAFTADYAGGTIRCNPDEIADAQWFDIDVLPELPPPISIARHLIDTTVARLKRST